MRTIKREKSRWSALFPAVIILMVGISLPGFAAPPPAGGHRFYIAAATGYFYPGQDTFRKIYAKALWSVELQLGWELNRQLALFGAARYMRASGSTILLSPIQPDESYALRLEVLYLRLGMNYRFRPRRFTPFLGAGLLAAFFKEEWLDVDLRTQGWKTGLFAQAGGRYRLGRSLHLLAQMDYSSVPAGAGGIVDERVNLGGMSLMLGLEAGIF
jgi:hypothetical protein